MDNAKNKRRKKALCDLDFGELISKFIAKDSNSNIQQSSIMSEIEATQAKTDNANNRPSA